MIIKYKYEKDEAKNKSLDKSIKSLTIVLIIQIIIIISLLIYGFCAPIPEPQVGPHISSYGGN